MENKKRKEYLLVEAHKRYNNIVQEKNLRNKLIIFVNGKKYLAIPFGDWIDNHELSKGFKFSRKFNNTHTTKRYKKEIENE